MIRDTTFTSLSLILHGISVHWHITPASLAHFLQHLGITGKKVAEAIEAIHTTAKDVFNNIMKSVTSVMMNESG
jgi:hypothetical protein